MVQTIKNYLKRFIYLMKAKLKQKYRKRPQLSVSSPSLLEVNSPLSSSEIEVLAKKYSGKLLLRHEIHLDESLFQLLLNKRKFTSKKSIIQTFFGSRCVRCNNKDPALLRTFPCARCRKEHLYCRKCIMMGKISSCESLYEWTGPSYAWPKHINACTWHGTLTPLQQEASDRLLEAIDRREELLVWAVTGAGKTELLFPSIEKALESGMRLCIATPRADVVRELLPRLKKAFKNIDIQALYGESRDRESNAQIIIATTHQLLRFKEAFDVLIIDEIDAFPYHADPMLPFVTRRARKQHSTTIYLTATPRDELKRRIRQKRLSYCFIPLRYHGYPLPVPSSVADYSLTKYLQKNKLPRSVKRWLINRHIPKRQLLLFVPTIPLAERIVEELSDFLLIHKYIDSCSEVAFVHAEDPLREEKVKQFRQKKLYALVTTTILERGVTFPSVDVAVLQADHVVFDRAALVQIAGRAGRNKEDPKGEVIFFHQGKTEAIVLAIEEIVTMNHRGKRWKENRRLVDI